jgi:hypothetical protein
MAGAVLIARLTRRAIALTPKRIRLRHLSFREGCPDRTGLGCQIPVYQGKEPGIL